MPNSEEIQRTSVNQELMAGARNVILSSLNVGSGDIVTILGDESSMEVIAALLRAIDEVGAQRSIYLLERFGPRPISELPLNIRQGLAGSTVSIYTAMPVDGEFAHRKSLLESVPLLRLRHAHMVRITTDALMQGMRCDYDRVDRLNDNMINRLNNATQIRVTTKKGTDYTVRLDLREPWERSAGKIKPGEWHNLPNGEIAICPASVDGVVVCDGIAPLEETVSSFDMGSRPLRIELKGGRMKAISGGPDFLAERVRANLSASPDMDRIGMFAVGTNFELLMPIGDPIQDFFVPGAYLGFGRVSGNNKAKWTTSNNLPFTARRSTLLLDDVPVIQDGRYVDEIVKQSKI